MCSTEVTKRIYNCTILHFVNRALLQWQPVTSLSEVTTFLTSSEYICFHQWEYFLQLFLQILLWENQSCGENYTDSYVCPFHSILTCIKSAGATDSLLKYYKICKFSEHNENHIYTRTTTFLLCCFLSLLYAHVK